jgi:hypothetical protein
VFSFLLFLFSLIPIIVHGYFDNEFLRLTIYMMSIVLTFYTYLHWLVRWVSIFLHIIIVWLFETYYYRELLLQLACTEESKLNSGSYNVCLDLCAGGNNFNELTAVKILRINNGSVLVNGRIEWKW